MAEAHTRVDEQTHNPARPPMRHGERNRSKCRRTGAWLVCCLLVLSMVPRVAAAADSGQLLGLVRDPAGQALANVHMVLTGSSAEHAVASDENGRFRVDDLPPGNYALKIEEEGFCPVVYEPIYVRIGRSTTLRIRLAASLDETVVVTSEPPQVATLSPDPTAPVSAELARLPVGSDPFSSPPGLSLPPAEETSASLGQSRPSPGHGDSNGEVEQRLVTTSGVRSAVSASFEIGPGETSDPVSTPVADTWQVRGLGTAELELVTRRLHRSQIELSAGTGSPADSIPGGDQPSNDVSQLLASGELGAQAGGQLLRDHLFGWGSHRRQEARRRSIGGIDETLEVSSDALELSAPLGTASFQLGFLRSRIRRDGLGAGPDRSRESTLEGDQPSEVLKLEGQQILGRGFAISARIADWSSGRYRIPQAWRDQPASSDPLFLDADGVWVGAFGDFSYLGEHRLWQLEATREMGRGAARHEMRIGVASRRSDSFTEERWGSDGTVHLGGEVLGLPFDLVRIVRPLAQQVERESLAFWIGDSLRFRRFTLDFALRHDQQSGRNAPGSVEAHPVLPELLPGFEHSGGGAGFDWNTTLPRLSAAWTLDRQGRTVLRSTFGIYASRLDDDMVGRVSPGAPAELVLTFSDTDDDSLFDPGEAFLLMASQGIDPAGTLSTSAHLNPLSLEPEETEEWSLGVEHAPNTAWTFGLDLRQQNTPNALELRTLVRETGGLVRVAQSSDYVLDQVLAGQLSNGSTYLAPVWALSPSLEATGGHLLINGDRRKRSRQISLIAHRRLLDGWQLRARLLVRDQEWRLGESFSRTDDPTNLAPGNSADAGISLADGQGDPVGTPFDGKVDDSRWAFEIFSLVRIAPRRAWSFDASLVLRGREGFSIPYQATVVGSDGLVRNVQLTPESDTYRLDDVLTADLRVEKDWTLARLLGGSQLAVGLDVFNLFDQRTVLEQESRSNVAQSAVARATLHPRSVRLGVRWSW